MNPIERFPIVLKDGTLYHGTIYQSPYRRTGRRITVEDDRGAVLLDTGCHYDLGNAINALNLWLQQKEAVACNQL